MMRRRHTSFITPILLTVVMAATASDALAQRGRGQGPGGGAPEPQRSPREAAYFDLQGYWVPLITEDWETRVLMPKKGEYRGVPLTPAARKVADAWDAKADLAAGNQCRAFGAAGLSRMPVRLHITWQDDRTLRVESDAGMQTRLLRFDASAPGEPTLQGHSVAAWEKVRQSRGFGPGPTGGPGSLRVVTTGMAMGYLRPNGVPYGPRATMTEYFHRHTDFGREYFTVLTVVEDPEHLTRSFVTSTHFMREPDASKWAPVPCEALTAP